MSRPVDSLTQYCEALSTPPSPLMEALERETHLKTLAPQMLSGHLQGQLLQMLCQLKQPKQVLEIGTFTGYATLYMAAGLPEDGLIHTIEANPELEYLIRKYIEQAHFQDKIQLHIGKAEALIPELPGHFDFVFLDAGKLDYPLFYDLIIDRVTSGGLIIADNVLWSGKVVQNRQDKDTQALHAFNQKIQDDPRVNNLILPIRDGLLIAQKK
ncbi:MAG: O-methyltransferase [Saprospiraceae bacterium]|nr:O-methyltransferase [Saprospiraceae bacterium]